MYLKGIFGYRGYIKMTNTNEESKKILLNEINKIKIKMFLDFLISKSKNFNQLQKAIIIKQRIEEKLK
jgi:hypothetical protein